MSDSDLYREIYAQPEVLAQILAAEAENVLRLAGIIRQHGCKHIVIAARGSSDNAAIYGKYLFAVQNALSVSQAAPSLYTLYHQPPNTANALVIGISQSGHSIDIVEVLRQSRRQGALTLAITNDPSSPLAQVAEYTILLHAGPERSLAATKTYTAQLLALALLSSALVGPDTRREQELQAIPAAATATLELEATIQPRADRYRYMEYCVVLGRGFNYATAYEVALKLKELTYILAEPYSSADFQHGPIALVEWGFPVIFIAPQGVTFDSMQAQAKILRSRNAELLVISDNQEILNLGDTRLQLPVSVPEWLSPITAVIPGQLLALHLTLAKGYDPDHPRGLRKVTRTL
ncbi:MAG: SIS domain-containing protein [Chloroflexi bacterium]|nr:SIS domain-containing protein [Chloroflexota bacterium]